MPKRTLKNAPQYLQAATPMVNQGTYSQMEAELKAAQAKALGVASETATRKVAELTAQRQQVLEDVCGVRDELAALAAEGKAGRLSGKEYREALAKLNERQRSLQRHEQQIAKAVESVAAIEDDPEGYADSLYERFPNMQPDFSF